MYAEFSSQILIMKLEQMKIIFEYKLNCLTSDLDNLFHKNKDTNCHITQNASKRGFFIPQIRTLRHLEKFTEILSCLWNKHLKIDDRLNTFTKICPFKKYSSYNVK